MLWGIIGIAVLIIISLLCIVWAALAVASRADDQMDEWLASRDEPRCDVTCRRLTPREQFDKESG